MTRKGISKIQHIIKRNFSEPLSLAELAKHAFLSPFHFQRIFKEGTGESPKQYLSRVRLEAAAHSLVTGPDQSILAVALDCGFNSLEHFSRAFKKAYSISPNKFRELPESDKIQLLQTVSGRSDIDFSIFNQDRLNSINPREMDIQVIKLPQQQAIGLHTNLASMPGIDATFESLQRWAGARELIDEHTQWLGLVMDYPLFTELDKCHYVAAMTVQTMPALSDDVQAFELPAATYASVPVRSSINDLLKDMTLFWKIWLPQSGFRMKHDTGLHMPQKDLTQVSFVDNEFRLLMQIEPD